jgi:hypothetical protein
MLWFLEWPRAASQEGVAIRILVKMRVHPESPVNPADSRGLGSPEPLRVESRHSVRDKRYLVRFKYSTLNPNVVIAASVEIHGEHLVFLRSDGRLAALYVLEIIESWPEVDSSEP